LWPMQVSTQIFPLYYEHPPGILWAMAFFQKLPLPLLWTSALFSRLCTLGVFALGFHLLRKKAGEAFVARSVLFAVLLLTWGQFLKYAGAAQLEGPTALVVLLWAGLFLRNETGSAKHFLGALALGLLGLLSKGILFAPLLLGAVVVSLPGNGLTSLRWGKALGLALGFGLGVAWLSFLDQSSGTDFQGYYWKRLALWASSGAREHSSGIFERLWGFLRGELRYSGLWSLPLWALMLRTLVREGVRGVWRDPVHRVFFVFYLLFMGPIVMADIKMPHWPVPIYPLAALWISYTVPVEGSALFRRWVLERKVLSGFTVVLAVVLATFPYPVESVYGRGEEWIFHREFLLRETRPLVVTALDHREYPDKVYAALFLGRDYPLRFESTAEALQRPCGSELLWVHREQFVGHESEFSQRGWAALPHQHPNAVLLECVTR